MTKARHKTQGRHNKKLIALLAFLVIAFAGGFYLGRATSTDWDNEETAFTYMCRASHRVNGAPDGTRLRLTLPDASFKFDGTDVAEITDELKLKSDYPALGAAEYEDWVAGVVSFGAGAATAPLWEAATSSNFGKVVGALTTEERLVISALTLGSGSVGYLLGHRFKADFNAPKFRRALRDKAVWQRVWTVKQQWLRDEAELDQTMKNLDALIRMEEHPSNELSDLRDQTLKGFQHLWKLDPELQESYYHTPAKQ